MEVPKKYSIFGEQDKGVSGAARNTLDNDCYICYKYDFMMADRFF